LIDKEEYEVDTSAVLRLCKASNCSAYDCEYVALAEFLDLEFVTADSKLAKAFPGRALLLSEA
jgi:predicted nucleic acid-binding protein